MFARYLLGVDPPPELAERYARAHATLGLGPAGRLERWAIERPALLPAIDAALAVVEPEAELRRRLRIMAAILEASPTFADEFLRPAPSARELVGTLAAAGLRTAARLPVGLALVLLARRLDR